MKLYGYWRSSCSYRVRIALALKRVPYENLPVHLRNGGQNDEEYLKKNPLGQVPTLILDDERTLTQSMAILEYLDLKFPDPRLFPREPYRRARVIQLCEMVNAGIQPLQNLRLLTRLDELGVDARTFAREEIGRGLRALEQELRLTAGRFAFGDEVTAADALLVPQMYNARRFGVDLSELPTAVQVDGAASALEAFEAAHPDIQPDREG